MLEAGLKPSTIVGTSIGALDGGVIACWPNLRGADLLRDLWLSEAAREVFHFHPLAAIRARLAGTLGPFSPRPIERVIARFERVTGCTDFEQLRVPLLAVATDLEAGRPVVFRSGPLAPALMASAAIPGLFPPVRIGGRDYSDGGILDNVPMATASREGYRRMIAVGLMAVAELHAAPSSWTELMARTLQLGMHHHMLSDFERLRTEARIVMICPITPTGAVWKMERPHLESLMARSYEGTARLLDRQGTALFDRSAIHYLDLTENKAKAVRSVWLGEPQSSSAPGRRRDLSPSSARFVA
jgi:NTE family protein